MSMVPSPLGVRGACRGVMLLSYCSSVVAFGGMCRRRKDRQRQERRRLLVGLVQGCGV
jgi:hypothetical protein